VAAEGGVLEKSGDELVIFHLGNVLLFEGTLSRSEGHKQAGVGALGALGAFRA